MKLSKKQIQQYEEDGFLFFPGYFSEKEVSILQRELSRLPEGDPGRMVENDNKTVRALHGCHTHSEIFKRLIQHPRLLEPVQQILKELVYLYQFKINMKAAFTGDAWPWHQDYVFWYKEDGMPTPEVVNISIFLDEVNHFNGPLYLIPGSHKEGMVDVEAQIPNSGDKDADWQANVSANLKYCLNQTNVAQMVEKGGMVAPVGPRGSVLFFHGNVAHASVPNISPYDRRIIIITYNSIKNIPISKGKPRPEFLVCQDYVPLQPARDDVLLQQTNGQMIIACS
ncbi:phytanoyl-CoA dioxygenase family protein [Brasilonema sp. CT11]|nr:phytanoyl-CoA dioxygenase family protein [Brasilonema sp. CT11]